MPSRAAFVGYRGRRCGFIYKSFAMTQVLSIAIKNWSLEGHIVVTPNPKEVKLSVLLRLKVLHVRLELTQRLSPKDGVRA